jgi:hypothetical protein
MCEECRRVDAVYYSSLFYANLCESCSNKGHAGLELARKHALLSINKVNFCLYIVCTVTQYYLLIIISNRALQHLDLVSTILHELWSIIAQPVARLFVWIAKWWALTLFRHSKLLTYLTCDTDSRLAIIPLENKAIISWSWPKTPLRTV